MEKAHCIQETLYLWTKLWRFRWWKIGRLRFKCTQGKTRKQYLPTTIVKREDSSRDLATIRHIKFSTRWPKCPTIATVTWNGHPWIARWRRGWCWIALRRVRKIETRQIGSFSENIPQGQTEKAQDRRVNHSRPAIYSYTKLETITKANRRN